MINNINFNSPTILEIDNGISKRLSNYLKKLKIKKPLIITDSVLVDIGTIDKIIEANSEFEFTIFQDIPPEPPLKSVEESFKLYKENKCDGIVAIGGGSPIDVAKAVALLATNKGDFQDFVGIGNVPNRCAPLITIPTTSGTGSEVSKFSIIIVNESKLGVVDSNICAHIALVDPELTYSVPRNVTAATGIDTLCHHIETFLSIKASPLSDLIAKEGIKIVSKYLRKAIGNPLDKKSRYMMSYASALGGFSMNLTEGAAANHALAFALGAKFNIGHGLSNAILLPYVFPVIAKAEIEKIRIIGKLMGEDVNNVSDSQVIKIVTDGLRNLVSDVKCNYKLNEIGVTKEDIESLVEETLTQERVLSHSTYKLTREEIYSIFESAL